MSDNNKSAPATKDDLKELATKTELKELGQKLTGRIDAVEQKLTDKIDGVEQKLTGRIDSVAVEVAKTNLRIDRMENNMMETLRSFKSDILSSIDAFAAEALSYRNHDTLRGRAIMDHDEKLKDHETRLTTLETK